MQQVTLPTVGNSPIQKSGPDPVVDAPSVETREFSLAHDQGFTGGQLTGNYPPSAIWSRSGLIQAKLEIGSPNDAFEHEADAVADAVSNKSLSTSGQYKSSNASGQRSQSIQRKCAACAEEEKPIQRKISTVPTSAVPQRNIASNQVSNQIQHTRGGGQRLDAQTRSLMERNIGYDFSQIRIHTGDYSAKMNRELNARAFTVGNDIYFNSGQYQPQSQAGTRLLAHELTHTVQQNQIGTGARIQRDGVDPEIADLPATNYLDFFTNAYYDLDYRSVGGNLSTWAVLEYSDGTVIDFNLYDIMEQKDPAYSPVNAMSNGHLGPGDRIVPAELNSVTLPNLWKVRAEARRRMEEYNYEFMLAALPAVIFIITAAASATLASKPTPRSSVATRIRERMRLGYKSSAPASAVAFKAASVADDLFNQVAGVVGNGRKMLAAGRILSAMRGLTAPQKLEAMLAFFNKIGFATKGAPRVTATFIEIVSEDGKYMFQFMKDTGFIRYAKIDTQTFQWIWTTL